MKSPLADGSSLNGLRQVCAFVVPGRSSRTTRPFSVQGPLEQVPCLYGVTYVGFKGLQRFSTMFLQGFCVRRRASFEACPFKSTCVSSGLSHLGRTGSLSCPPE